MESP
jgi:hypothetical protein